IGATLGITIALLFFSGTYDCAQPAAHKNNTPQIAVIFFICFLFALLFFVTSICPEPSGSNQPLLRRTLQLKGATQRCLLAALLPVTKTIFYNGL
ncbi:MAG: hypothetical protein RLZZ316_497, partial [Bacteroidota bacterium]